MNRKQAAVWPLVRVFLNWESSGMHVYRRKNLVGLYSTSALLIAAIFLGAAHAETPDSPRVKALVKKGAEYLEQKGNSEYVGGKCLIAMTLYKAGVAVHPLEGGADHPKVTEAIDAIHRMMGANRNDRETEWGMMYSPCIAMIFLSEYDHEKYQSEINSILDFIYSRQVKQGAWGYIDDMPGDVSQTQYACLAMWYARMKAGIKVPKARGKAALDWLVQTQAPDGTFFYQQSIPPSGTGRRNHSLAAAGMSSVYITSDWLGLNAPLAGPKRKGPKRQGDFDLPATVSLVGDEDGAVDLKDDSEKVQVANLDQCKQKGNAWFEKNFVAKVDIYEWQFYYLYGYERYAAFQEMAEGIDDPEPDWYNKGVDFLESRQRNDGAWDSPQEQTGVGTAFALLFLMRSTKQALNAAYESGSLSGGGELGEGKLSLRGGKIVSTAVTRNVGEILVMAEGASDQDWDKFKETLGDLKLDDDQKSRTQQLAKIRSLVSHKNYQARLIAVNQLGKIRDFNSVPVLIYALGDPDLSVANAAHEALRVMSRKFDTAPAGDSADLETFKDLKRRWKQWYLQIEPNAVFLD